MSNKVLDLVASRKVRKAVDVVLKWKHGKQERSGVLVSEKDEMVTVRNQRTGSIYKVSKSRFYE